jgi:hypothetical protein
MDRASYRNQKKFLNPSTSALTMLLKSGGFFFIWCNVNGRHCLKDKNVSETALISLVSWSNKYMDSKLNLIYSFKYFFECQR